MRSSGLIFSSLMFAVAVASVAGQAAAPAQAFRVGAARVEITPPLAPGSPAQTYDHERLYIRAVVLDNGTARVALITADQGGVPEDAWAAASKEIAAELGTPVQNILISATHTHSGNVVGPGQRAGGAGAAAPAGGVPAAPPAAAAPAPSPLVAPMLQAVRQARAALQPAGVGFGTGASWLNVNRDAIDPDTRKWIQGPNLEGHSDKTVAVLKFESLEGRPIAVYVNYAMHPVNAYLSGFVSADFPGAMSRHVEQAYGDSLVVLFSQGASGNQNPLYLRAGTNLMASRTGVPIPGDVLVRETVEGPLREGTIPARAPDTRVRDGLLRWIESQGMLLGEEVIRVMTNTTDLDSAPAIRGAQTMVTCAGRTRTGGAREGGPGQYTDADPVQIRLGTLVIGTTALASVNAEVYSPISQRLKQKSPLSNTVMVTLANGRAGSGYIPDDASFGHQTFQVNGSRLQPGCAETAIADGLSRLITASR